MKQKIKIYRLPLSRVFPATHPKAGEPTYFEYKIRKAIGISCVCRYCDPKFHTIRAINPDAKKTWFDKIKEVQEGNAVLVVYEWNEKPYSKDGCTNLFVFGTGAVKEFIDELLSTERYRTAIPVIDNGIGVRAIKFITESTINANGKLILSEDLARNDGLSEPDFRAWFKGCDLSSPMAIIHFTKFRY
jgi:hypothetical protein